MSIGPNQIVTINFTIKDKKGAIVDSTDGQAPYTFLSESYQMFPKIEEVIGGMNVGEKTSVTLKPADAYGEYRMDAVKVAKRSEFPQGVQLLEGMTLVTRKGGREIPVTIKKINGDDITIDYNHPMAGETLSFDLELLEKREATEEDFDDCGCGCGDDHDDHGHGHGHDDHGCGCGH